MIIPLNVENNSKEKGFMAITNSIRYRKMALLSCPLYNCPNPGVRNDKNKAINGFLFFSIYMFCPMLKYQNNNQTSIHAYYNIIKMKYTDD